MAKPKRGVDWPKADIKAELEKRGMTLVQVDRTNNLPIGICSFTCRHPHVRGEMAISTALGRRPEDLWPSRHNADGTRKCPQPAENYRPRPVGRHCQNGKAA